MGAAIVGSGRGAFVEINIVPLIDVLLVLLVIFMIIPHSQVGLKAALPQPAGPDSPAPTSEVIVVEVSSDGSLKINRQPVAWGALQSRLEEIFSLRASRLAFIQGDGAIEFSVVARAIDLMRGAGVASIGLLSPALDERH